MRLVVCSCVESSWHEIHNRKKQDITFLEKLKAVFAARNRQYSAVSQKIQVCGGGFLE